MTRSRPHFAPRAALVTPFVLALASACAGPGETDAEPPELRADAEGTLDKEAIREVVAAEIVDIRDCYDAELRDDDSLAGTIEIAFTIAADGSVHDLDVAESSMPERFDACVGASMSSWTFPATEGSTKVVYPFLLEPG